MALAAAEAAEEARLDALEQRQAQLLEMIRVEDEAMEKWDHTAREIDAAAPEMRERWGAATQLLQTTAVRAEQVRAELERTVEAESAAVAQAQQQLQWMAHMVQAQQWAERAAKGPDG